LQKGQSFAKRVVFLSFLMGGVRAAVSLFIVTLTLLQRKQRYENEI